MSSVTLENMYGASEEGNGFCFHVDKWFPLPVSCGEDIPYCSILQTYVREATKIIGI